MRKQLAFIAMAILSLYSALADELATKNSAKIEITTRTSYGVNLDNPNQNGLAMDFAELGIYYGMINGGFITNKIKTDEPIGFIQLELGSIDTRFTTANGLNPDDNNPATVGNDTNHQPDTDTGMGWNAANSHTGYWSPVYIERLVSGIAWGDWLLQLAAGGDPPENWRPWSRNNGSYATSEIINRWAYMETRLQYQRPSIPVFLQKNPTPGKPIDESSYWLDGDEDKNIDLNLYPKGSATIGLAWNTTDFSMMLKYASERDWMTPPPANDPQNGTGLGYDLMIAPSTIKGMRVFASATKEFNWGTPGNPQPFAAGGKFAYDISVAEGLSLEPYVGYETVLYDSLAGSTTNQQEFAGGVTLHWPGNGGWQYDPLQQRNGVLFPGLTIAYTLRDANLNSDTDLMRHNLRVTMFEESSDYGLIPGIGSELSVQYNNLSDGDNSQLLATLYFDYTINDIGNGSLIPWTKIYFDNIGNGAGSGRSNNLKTDVGIKLAKLIKNTVIGLTWESKNLLGINQNINDLNTTNGYYGFGFINLWAEIKL